MRSLYYVGVHVCVFGVLFMLCVFCFVSVGGMCVYVTRCVCVCWCVLVSENGCECLCVSVFP